VVKALLEDLLLPVVEHNFWRPPRRSEQASGPSEGDEPTVGERPNVGRWAHPPLALATALMKLDVALFGRIRTGPFFLLLRAVEPS
jgi:hypothetical protein